MARTQPAIPDRSSNPWMIVAALAVVGAVVRIWAALDDFWLDEVWSLYAVEQLGSPLGVFTGIHSDNNHYLVSLWMAACGTLDNWFVYRIPSLLAGVGTIVLAALCARPWSRVASVAATLLTATSYVLIVYASEARGYALAGFFALAAYLALDRYLTARRWRSAVAFSLLVPLGFLAHLTFGHFYFGALVWSTVRLAREAPRWRQAVQGFAMCHALPLGVLAILYYVDVRHIVIGGGPGYVMREVIAEALALAVGAPPSEPLVSVGAVAAAAVGLAGIGLLWRANSDKWILFAAVIFLSPLLLLSASRPEYLNIRYFYVNLVFLLLLAGYVAARTAERGGTWRLACGAALALVVAGNAYQTFDFLRFGRGEYRAAVDYIAAHSQDRVIRVMSDHDFRNPLLLQYYARRLPATREVDYYPQSAPPPTAPEWWIAHSEAANYRPPQAIVDRQGNRYELARAYPYAGLSGFHWAIYHRSDLHRPER